LPSMITTITLWIEM